jgi:hypothetical protein
MATATTINLLDFCNRDVDTTHLSVNEKLLIKPEIATKVEKALISMARQERVKALAFTVVGAGATFLLAEVAYIAFTISYVAGYIFFLPLILIPPVYKLAILGASSGIGLATGILMVRKFAVPFYEQGNVRWQYANHLYDQAAIAHRKFEK